MQGTYGNGRLVTVFGGSGFLGRNVVRALAMRGYRVRAAVRRPDLAGFLRPLGMVGQVHAVQANVRYPESVAAALQGAVAAVNLVGILQERGKQTFEAVQSAGAGNVASAVAGAGIETLVHVSAIGADQTSRSSYFRTKAEGESAVRAAMPGAIIMRPSIQFGPGDSFLTRFANMARVSPVLPIVGPDTRFQLVFVADVAEAIARAVDGNLAAGTTYELGGPEILTFRETMERVLQVIDRRRPIIALPFGVARPVAPVLQRLPGRVITSDQVRQLRHDVVVSDAAITEHRTLRDIGVEPTALGAVLPSYLYHNRPRGQFNKPRDAEG